MSVTDTRVATAPAVLRTATGREAGRWVAAHCREVPWLTAATVLTTVAGAALQVLPVLLLGRVVDAVAGDESQSVLVTIGALMVAAALLGAAATAVSTWLIGRLGADLLARLREAPSAPSWRCPARASNRWAAATCCPGSATTSP